jgi:DNA-binding MarR family transcriptional regulator
MTAVKARDPHAAILLAQLLSRIRMIFDDARWDGLRTSHFRVLSAIPADGVTITELADRLGMTKQAGGQFVTFLAGGGYVDVGSDPADRRIRVVRRTRRGDTVVAAAERQIAVIEDEWTALVGPRRYATFRAVMAEIADLGAAGSA